MKNAYSRRFWLAVLLCLALGALLVTPAFAQAPANDDFDNATVIAANPFSDTVDMSEATSAPDDPQPSCDPTSHTVWYQFTPAEDVRLSADTFGSDYDTLLSVWTGERGSLSEIACNDDTSTLQSRVIFDTQAGVTYYFMVGSFADTPGGQLVFNLDVAPPVLELDLSVDPLGRVKPSTGVITITGLVDCSRPAFGEIFIFVEQTIGRFKVQASGDTSFENCAGPTPWSITVVGETGLFVGGKAEVNAFAYAFTEDYSDVANDEEFLTVRLRVMPARQ